MARLSKRSERALGEAPHYKKVAFELGLNQYSRTNPDGYVNFSIAENRISAHLVEDRLAAVPPLPREHLCYGAMAADVGCANALAPFISTHITKQPVDPAHLVVTCGASAAIDQLLFALSDAGDAVMVVAPGYNGFEYCATTRSGVRVIAAQLERAQEFRIDVNALERTRQEAGGARIRSIIICSPGNPTGEVLTAESIRAIVQWARSHSIHCIFDEIYALSVHSHDSDFISAAQALDNDLGDDVHILWALSKDFCASGLRVGVVLTHSDALLNCLAHISIFGDASRLTQWAVQHMLSDAEFIDKFLTENKRRLASAYGRITALMRADKVPFVRAEAGMFLLVDLRRWLRGTPSKEAEMELWWRLVRARVLLTPCSEAFSRTYGIYRLCFGAVLESTLDEGWRRVRQVLFDK